MTSMKFKARGHVLVRFRDDPVLLHHRWVLKRVGKRSRYWVATPDREVWLTKLEVGDKYSEIVPFSGTRMPEKVRRRDVHCDKDSDEGAFDEDEFEALLEDVRDAGGGRRACRNGAEGEAEGITLTA